jgi:hypothetical protein
MILDWVWSIADVEGCPRQSVTPLEPWFIFVDGIVLGIINKTGPSWFADIGYVGAHIQRQIDVTFVWLGFDELI